MRSSGFNCPGYVSNNQSRSDPYIKSYKRRSWDRALPRGRQVVLLFHLTKRLPWHQFGSMMWLYSRMVLTEMESGEDTEVIDNCCRIQKTWRRIDSERGNGMDIILKAFFHCGWLCCILLMRAALSCLFTKEPEIVQRSWTKCNRNHYSTPQYIHAKGNTTYSSMDS